MCVISTKNTGRNAKRTTTKPRLRNRIRSYERPCNHNQLHNQITLGSQSTNHKFTRAGYREKLGARAGTECNICAQLHYIMVNHGIPLMHKPSLPDIHKHYTTDTNIQKQAQGKTLITNTDIRSGAALAMPEADPAGIHKEAANAVLEASVGLAEALSSWRTPEKNRSLVKGPSPCDMARFPMSESRRITGVPKHPNSRRSPERCEAVSGPNPTHPAGTAPATRCPSGQQPPQRWWR
jgi:hypothetical protein